MNPQKPGHLSKRQKLVIEDLIKNGLSEYEVLENTKSVPPATAHGLKTIYSCASSRPIPRPPPARKHLPCSISS